MVLSGMDLLNNPADAGAIVSHDHEEVFSDESHFLVCRHDFDMGEPLSVRTYLVLAFYNEYPTGAQDAACFFPSVTVKL